jgi:hypothetical protein
MPALTAASVTDKQIRDLRAEAVQTGDWRQVDLCDVALGIRPQHTATDRGSIKDSSGRSITRAKARSACAKVISYAQGEAGHRAAPSRHHATKKTPTQLQREIDETLTPKVAGFVRSAGRKPGYQIVSVPIFKGPRGIGPSGLDSPRARNESVVFASRGEAEAYLPSVKRFAADFGRDALIKEVW